VDQPGDSFLLAVDRRSGRTVWRKDRLSFQRGWSTPVYVRDGNVEMVIVLGGRKLVAYDLQDGAQRWWINGMPPFPITTPVFADVCDDSLNLDPEQVARRITSRTKAVIPVDYAGHPADLDSFSELAQQNGLVIIEDAAHALGAEYKGQRVGSISHMTIFSFHPVKHITTGEGGMVTTDNPELASRLRMFRNHGIDPKARQQQGHAMGQWYYEMTELGYNYRLSDIGCALGLSQLHRLTDNLKRRREIAGYYTEALAELPGIVTPIERPETKSAWHLYPVRIQLDRFGSGRKELFQALRAENIEVNVHYIPVHLHPYYRRRFGHQDGEYPMAEAAYESLISLPLFPGMLEQDAQDVIQAMRKVFGHYLLAP
ncbi:MAG: DegT/DnrJ/EryC1/StrS family aminotransferase, partial [Chloroflexi bacterium]|nr:DegT/DnrJ/EryC1/StrS family aminotransferase [Chloroflexota bacterium]